MKRFRNVFLVAFTASTMLSGFASADEPIKPIDARYASDKVDEVPNFQRHVVPLLSRLGCSGRACHGSFQGRGGFRLSLFGYDFETDHKALTQGDEPRVNLETPAESLILSKPTSEDEHEGGERFKPASWQYHVLQSWIKSGAKDDSGNGVYLKQLAVTPHEILYQKDGQNTQLRAVAIWSDGTQEDVTPLCRFQTNDDSVAIVSESGQVTSKGKGDSEIVVIYDNGITPVTVLRPVSDQVAANYPKVATPTKIDELVVTKLRKLGIAPSEVCGDAEFLRRASLDITGTLPTSTEVKAFLADTSPKKRSAIIDQLLARPEHAAWWATRFSDLTGNNSQFSGNNQFRNEESRQWYDWLYSRVADNTPYDEMIAGLVVATGRSEGQSFEEYCEEMGKYYRKDDPVNFGEHATMPHYWSRRNVRKPEEKALSFAHAFLGVRLQCAQCHKHPFDQWSKKDFEQFTSFFAAVQFGTRSEDRDSYKKMTDALGLKGKKNKQGKALAELVNEGKAVPWQEVYVSFQQARRGGKKNNKKKPNKNKEPKVVTATLLGGVEFRFEEGQDPRKTLMDWMRSQDNPYFVKAYVNRVWASYFNVGIIDPPDNLNLANPPSNPALLDWLCKEFVAQGYDMRWLHRTIVSSDTYQRSWQANDSNRLDTRNFSHAVVRRLPAEVLLDALNQATASDAELADKEALAEKRAVGPSSGYQVRGNQRNAAYALATFGKPQRVTNCDCERSVEPSLLQTLFLRNDQQMHILISRRGGWLDQIARENILSIPGRSAPVAGKGNRNKNQKKQLERFEIQIKQVAKQLKAAKKAGNEKQITQLKNRQKAMVKRLAALKKRFGVQGKQEAKVAKAPAVENSESAKEPVAGQAENSIVAQKGEGWIREIYLRTVSRPPTDQELSRSTEHLKQAKDPISGLRDVLWAMLNTKEFIVNH